MTKNDYQPRLQNFMVLRNKFDQDLFKYGPIILVVQICISVLIFFIEGNNPFGPRSTFRWFELTFFLFALMVLIIEVYVAKDFFASIPITFIELTKRNILKGLKNSSNTSQTFGTFLADFEKVLNYRIPLILGGIIEVFILLALQRSGLFPILSLPKNYPITILLLNFLTIFFPMTIAGYMISIVIWKCFATGYFVHRFSDSFELIIQPSHPDKVGGLKPLGDLMFSMALILIVASLALSVLTVASQINTAIFSLLLKAYSTYQIQAPYYLYSTELLAKFFLGVAILLSFAVFILPIRNTHQAMRESRANLISSLAEVGNKISQLETQARKINIDYRQRNEAMAEIASLSKVYEAVYKAPVWPFDREILIKFFTPQLVSLLSLFGVVQPIIDVISSWAY